MISVYDDEFPLYDKIRHNFVTSSALIIPTDDIDIDELKEEALKHSNEYGVSFSGSDNGFAEAIQQNNFMPFSSILVSSLWNGNDDIFTGAELIAAVDSPKLKPINWMHRGSEVRGNEIIGVMVRSSLWVGEPGGRLSELIIDSLSEADELNDLLLDTSGKVHIRQDGIIWDSYFPTYAEKIRKGIEDRNLFVSMEAFFKNFGFAMSDGSQIELVERNDQNAAISWSLKAFGGSGELEVEGGKKVKVGRWLRGVHFSGQGVVEKPANKKNGKPFSIILPSSRVEFATETTTSFTDTVTSNKNVYKYFRPILTEVDTMPNDDKTSNNVSNLQEQFDKVVAERDEAVRRVAELEDSVAQNKISDLSKEVDVLSATNKQLEDKISELSEAGSKLEEMQEEITKLTENKVKLEAELEEIRALEVARTRMDEISAIKADIDLGYSLDDYAGMSDETFASIKKTLEVAVKAGISGEPKLTEQSVSGQPKLTEQTVSPETKLTEASAKDEANDATKAIEEADDSDEADLLVSASVDSNTADVAKSLLTNIMFKK